MTLKAPSIGIDSRTISRHRVKVPGKSEEYVSDPALARLAGAVDKMRTNALRAFDLAQAISADHSVTGTMARSSFNNDAMALYRAAAKEIDSAMEYTLREIGQLSDGIRPKAMSDKAMAAEIRGRLASMKPADRDKLLATNEIAMQAVANGPAFLSGMSDELRDGHVKAWSAKNFPTEFGRLQRLGKALDDARRIGIASDAYFSDLAKTMARPLAESQQSRTKSAQTAAREAVA